MSRQTQHSTGLERDSESGLDHAQFRQYASTQGRWLSPDPYMSSYDLSNPQSFNRYAYVMNNPMRFVDPLGLDPNCQGEEDTDPGCEAMGGRDPNPSDGSNYSWDTGAIVYRAPR